MKCSFTYIDKKLSLPQNNCPKAAHLCFLIQCHLCDQSASFPHFSPLSLKLDVHKWFVIVAAIVPKRVTEVEESSQLEQELIDAGFVFNSGKASFKNVQNFF